MGKYDAYYGRLGISGSTKRESVISSTKRQAHNLIMKSPSLRTVEHMELVEQLDKTMTLETVDTLPSIVSDKETFYKRTILFRPDEGVKLGSYIKYDGKVYLTTNISDVDVYPQAFVDFCNYELLIKGIETKTMIGKDSMGRPQYNVTKADYTIPCVVTSKIYSVLDNSQIPLPEGAVMIYIPFHEKIKVPINYEFKFHDDIYQITTVNPVNVLKDEFGVKHGYLEMRGQKDVKKP